MAVGAWWIQRTKIIATHWFSIGNDGRISAGVLVIRTLRRRICGILPLTRWLTHTAATGINIVLSFPIVLVNHTIHIVASAIGHIIIDAETGSPTGTATLALVVSGQCVAASESAPTFRAGVWTFSGMKFCVAFQVVETAETRLARGALVGFLLAVREEMTLEVVMAREIGGAVGTLVALRGGRLRAVVSGQTHLARWRARVFLLRHWARKCECTIPRVVWIWRDRLVVMLMLMWRRLLVE
jgi:hypothetical protein